MTGYLIELDGTLTPRDYLQYTLTLAVPDEEMDDTKLTKYIMYLGEESRA
jgi:hypothetical protein